MKSIERRFDAVKKKCPAASSYLCFYYAVKGQQFSKQMISRWFNKLVSEDDYGDGEKIATIAWYVKASNMLEDDQKTSIRALKSAPTPKSWIICLDKDKNNQEQ
jgi:hypothetical protein